MSMRKILTRLATVALILIVMISFSACSLFTVNLDKKYSASVMVATAENDSLSISRQELYYGYLEWGYQYAQQMETNALLEYVTSALLNNKILEKKSIALYGDLRDAEKAFARKQAFESLNTTIRTYIYEALDYEEEDTTDTETDAESSTTDQPYEPSILVSWENGERVFTMDLSSYEDTDGNGTLLLSNYTTYVPSIPGIASLKNAKQAVSKVVRNLQTLENGFTELKAPATDYLAKDSVYFNHLSQDERAVLNREIDRMVRSNQTSVLVSRISTGYNLGFFTLDSKDAKVAWTEYLKRGEDFTTWSNKINGIKDANATETMPAYFGCGRAIATNIANDVIEYYVNQGIKAINNQSNFGKNEDLESTLVSNGLADVYYIPSDVANNLYTVSHILVGFTDEQKAEYERINTEAEKNPSYNKQNDLNQLYAETKSNGVSAYDILLELQTELDSADSLQSKYDIFHKYIQQYNTDPGMQNLDQLNSSTNKQQYEYVMSSDAEKSQMVEPFTNASIKLFEKGIKGEISELVWTDYGAHIIMYTRDVADFVFTGVAGMEKESIENLRSNYADTLFATLTAYGNRTLFNTLIDSYFNRNVSNHQTAIINDYRSKHAVTIINSEFKDFI